MTERFAGYEHIDIAGWPVLLRRDPRFKRFLLSCALRRPLGADYAARAMLPALLQHGTTQHRDRPALACAKERLYGAHIGPLVLRHGEAAVLQFDAEVVAGDFLPGRPDQFGAARDLLLDCALRPRLIEDDFPAGLFAREQLHAVAQARAVFDDKGAYARQRALELACAGEPYGIPEFGGEAAIAAVRPEQPATMLRDFVQHGARVCIGNGALPDDAAAALAPLLGALEGQPSPLPESCSAPARAGSRVRERATMQQAKVVLVYRFPRPRQVASHCALQACFSLWGGGPHSRLFREVRERRSLCYYAGSSGDPHKGVATVQIGCDAAAVDAVVAETERQRQELADGRFEASELATALATIGGPLTAVDDTLAGSARFAAEQWVLGFDQEPAARLRSYLAVTAEEVAAAAASIQLDLDYALLPTEAAP